MSLTPGTVVRCEMSKWGERPHWAFEGVFLGEDEHGEWLGFPVGTHFRRPGADFTCSNHQVGLVPAPVDGQRPWCLPTFHDGAGQTWEALGGERIAVYVDMTTPAQWAGTTLRAVDLDLDVIGGQEGTVIVDDEDEFVEHQVRFGYPAEVVAAALASCEQALAAVTARAAPYDGTHRRWLDALAALEV